MSGNSLEPSAVTKAATCRPAEHRSSDVGTSRQWEVRIEWRRAPGVTWPPFSYAQKENQREAEAEAARAITFGNASADLCAVATYIRAPGATEWREVARRQEAASVADAPDDNHAATEKPT